MKNILKVGTAIDKKNLPTKVQKSFWKAENQKNQVYLLILVNLHAPYSQINADADPGLQHGKEMSQSLM